VLTGGDNVAENSLLYDEAVSMRDNAIGGNNTLVSGPAGGYLREKIANIESVNTTKW
jgi:hypothetical protein